MTLATATETISPPHVKLRRAGQLALSLDAFFMAASLAICALLFAAGGLEASLFALAGAAISARNAPQGMRLQGAYSGGFAGLFVGALFAAFFHDVLVRATQFTS